MHRTVLTLAESGPGSRLSIVPLLQPGPHRPEQAHQITITQTVPSLTLHGVFICSLFCPAGLFLILGLILYPAGWGCQKAIGYCGHYASAYKPGDCSLGWAFYTAIGGTVLTFICAVFSAQAEIATSSDKVQEEIEEGKNLICLL